MVNEHSFSGSMEKYKIALLEPGDRNSYKHLGNIIGKSRRFQQMSQADFAKAIGISRSTVSRIENGKAMRRDTILKSADALGITIGVSGVTRHKPSRNMIQYVVSCIHEFAAKYKLTPKEAFSYLFKYKGIDFLNHYYETEHLLSIEDAVEDLAVVCRKNGGKIA